MCIRKKMNIRIERNGIVTNKEIKSFRSCKGMLKYLKKQAIRIDPGARIIVLNNIPTLLIHRTGQPDMITVCPAGKAEKKGTGVLTYSDVSILPSLFHTNRRNSQFLVFL